MDKNKLLKSKVSSQMLNMMQTPAETETQDSKQEMEPKAAEKPVKKASEAKKASESNIKVEKVENNDNTNAKIDSDNSQKEPEKEVIINDKEENTAENKVTEKKEPEVIEITKEVTKQAEPKIKEETTIPTPEIKNEPVQETKIVTENETVEPIKYEIETDENDVEIFSVRLVGRSDYMQFILSTKKITKAEYIRQLVDADMEKNMPEFSRYMTMAKQYKEFLKTFGNQ